MEAPALNQSLYRQSFAVLVLALMPFIFTYLFTLLGATSFYNHGKNRIRPPIAPYWIPRVGHALAFLINPTSLALWVKSHFDQSLVRLRFFNVEVNMISGADAVDAVWRAKCLDSKPAVCIAMDRFFGTPKKALQFYNADDSGIGLQPHPKSSVEQRHRVYFHTHKVTQGFMTGPGLPIFTKRFQKLLRAQISECSIDENWSELPDLFSFLRDMLSTAAITTMCGPNLLALNPDLIHDLWQFDRSLPSFFKGYASWLAPKAWKSREKCLSSFKKWQAFAANHFTDKCIDEDGHDPYYGAPLMRSRQEYFSRMESLDEDALASENVGLMWAENANSVPATCWFVLEAMRNTELLRQVRDEAEGSYSASSFFDVEKLCSRPLLQSMFAETLRLRTIQFIVRGSDHEDFICKNWIIPKGEVVAVDTYTAHTNQEIWTTGGPGNPHPVNEFWAERFLVRPSDPNSGPLKHGKSSRGGTGLHFDIQDKETFSLSGLSGAWIPFGGGRRQCPGRTFAKQEIILGAAIFCSLFEIEFMTDVKPEPDMRYYGLGGLPPKKKIPCRIRRREHQHIVQG